MDSFIRSKYETRRWALDGPSPEDPSVLDTDTPISTQQPVQQQSVPAPPPRKQLPSVAPAAPARHQLLSATHRQQHQLGQQLQSPEQKPQQPTVVAEPAPTPQNDLFSLDFHSSAAPVSAATQEATVSRNAKQDIMSLFASSPPPTQHQVQTSWSQPQQPITQQQPKQQSMMGANGVGMWGVSSGWAPPPPQQQSQNIWGDFMSGTNGAVSMGMGQQPQQSLQMQMQYGGQSQILSGGHQQIPNGGQQQQQLFGTNDIWASSAPATSGNTIGGSTGGQKDAFDDVWGGFK
jgi:stromal membrane-associated protein